MDVPPSSTQLPIEDDEALYAAVLALKPDTAALWARVGDEEEHPLVRGAAARVLCDVGQHDAAWRLIANLHRDQRTYATVDALYHLEQVFGQTLGYDANLGYRHQTEKLTEWVDWYTSQFPDSEHVATLRELAARPGDASDEPFDPGDLSDEKTLLQAWRWLAERAKSRDPTDVAIVEAGFERLLQYRPEDPLLLNNYALAALNNGNWKTARAAYRKARVRTPKDAQLQNDIGILAEGLGQLTVAGEHYQRAVDLGLGDVAVANLADVRRKQGLADPARALYREAERLAPDKWYYHRLWLRRLPR